MEKSKPECAEKWLVLLLRIVGTTSLLATIAVYMPFVWMQEIHKFLGLGDLPKMPVVEYLARSASAFYAIVGALMWVISFDLIKYKKIASFLGLMFIIFGLNLLIIDIKVGLPIFWILAEGPFEIVFGLVVFLLSRKIE